MKNVTRIVLVAGGIAVIAVALTGLKYGCMTADTIIERKVYEESYQRSESLKARIAADEAVLAEIEVQLSNLELDSETRINLEAQARAARVRIATANKMRD